MSTPRPTRPIHKLASAVAKCSPEVSAYGKCIVADYNNVHKDKCLTEFLRLKECVRGVVSFVLFPLILGGLMGF
ncbi:hypothetical protein L873DRAFT_1778907 [Choiromyces venosus 120613-1]|uniref:IMS import disulfide relay-system CHCH-CHCH-like Cx9C domain-containing protein n=1 Tax=Choiromyces venosus 120613-1 TaxID=1336337 RepID=A0A3N4J732_9PEZI|nr:hypothetical protein L873DRAFT_1778907 [Choiromyces venosus 120613-1]